MIDPSGVPTVRLEPWTGPWEPGDPDANFKADVATYSVADPMPTITNLSNNVGVPVGAVVRSVLVKWASGGAEALLELGPTTVRRMQALVSDAEASGTDQARLAAYASLSEVVGWMAHGLDAPETTYPSGGAEPLD